MQGRAWDGNWAPRRQRTVRLGQQLAGKPSSGNLQAKILTFQITKATSARRLGNVLDDIVDGPIFDSIHASAAYKRLEALKRKGALRQRDWDDQVLLRLHARVEDMALEGKLGPRQTANVLNSLGHLSEQFGTPTQLLAALVKSVPAKVKGMNAFDLSTCMWASAKLKDTALVVLEMVSAIAVQIPNKAKDMEAEGLSNCLWASGQLKDVVAPDVLAGVSAIAAQIPKKAQDVKPQHLSNCLWAFVQLKDIAPDVLAGVSAIAAQIPKKAQDVKPQHLSTCLWAFVQLKDIAPDVLEAVLSIVGQIRERATDMVPQGLSHCLWASAQLKDVAPHVLDAVPAIAVQIPNKAKDMEAQGLSNCLWASGQLREVVPDVLKAVPALVAQIPNKANDMIPQHLSNCLFACAQLKDEVPMVMEIVPAIVVEISLKINDMVPQALSNSLEALILLRDSVPKVNSFLAAGGNIDEILRSAAKRLNSLLPGLKGKDFRFTVPVVVWACAKAGVYDGELLGAVATHLGSRSKLSALPDFGVCALSWSYQVLETQNDFKDFKQLLISEATERGLSEADVQSCELGRFGWKHA